MSVRQRTILRLQLILARFPQLVLVEAERPALAAQLSDLDELTAKFSQVPAVLTLLAAALRKLARDAEALDLANRALAIETSWSTLTTLGAVHRAGGRTDDAVIAFDRAAALEPTDTSALMEAARTLGEANRFAESASTFARVVKRSPEHVEARCWAAYAGWMATGAPEHRTALADLATSHPDVAIAAELLARTTTT